MSIKEKENLARRVWTYKLNYEPEEISRDAGKYWHKAMNWWIELLELQPIIDKNQDKWIKEYFKPPKLTL